MTAIRCLIALFFYFMICAVAQAAPITNLPPSVTPGAVEPERIKPRPQREDEYYLFDLIPSEKAAPKGDEGERTYVRSIILQGVNEHPEARLHLRDIRMIVERYRLMGTDKVSPQDQSAPASEAKPDEGD